LSINPTLRDSDIVLGSLHGHLGYVATDESTMDALVLAELVAVAERLLAVGALERFVVCVKRAIVAFEVFLATKKSSENGSDA
jgi:hypothetical protein